MRIPFLKKKKKVVQQVAFDTSNLASKDDIKQLSKEAKEARTNIIMANLSSRQREKLEKIIEAKREQLKHDKK